MLETAAGVAIVGAIAGQLVPGRAAPEEPRATGPQELEDLRERLRAKQDAVDASQRILTETWRRGPFSLFGPAQEAQARERRVPPWALEAVQSARRLVDEAAELQDLSDAYQVQIATAERDARQSLVCAPVHRHLEGLDDLARRLYEHRGLMESARRALDDPKGAPADAPPHREGARYKFVQASGMDIAGGDGCLARRTEYASWALVNCAMSGKGEFAWSFKAEEDVCDNESAWYGLATKEPHLPTICGAANWLAVKGFDGRFYDETSADHYRRLSPVHPGSTVHFRLNLAKGILTGWVDDENPVELVRSDRRLSKREWFPAVGCWGGEMASVRLVSCEVVEAPRAILRRSGTWDEIWNKTGQAIRSLRRQAVRASPDEEEGQDNSREEEEPAAEKPDLDIDLGIATVYRRRGSQEVLITAGKKMGEEAQGAEIEIEALLETLDYLVTDSQNCFEFMLVFDLRPMVDDWLPLDIVRRITHWMREEDNQAKVQNRCKCWKILVPGKSYFEMAQHSVLDVFFYLYPPVCRTLIVSVSDEGDEEVLVVAPGRGEEDQEACPRQGEELLFDVGVGGDVWLVGDYTDPVQPARPTPSCPSTRPTPSSSSSAPPAPAPAVAAGGREPKAPGAAEARTLLSSRDAGFLLLKGGERADGRGELCLLGKNRKPSEEGLLQAMEFMDDFSRTELASRGFAITYDFRDMPIPPMSMLQQLADWGNEPARKERWQRLNFACKVVVPGGMTYSLAKAVLTTYFYTCAPICRTYLLTDPDEPEEGAMFWAPPAPAEEAAELGDAAARPLSPGQAERPTCAAAHTPSDPAGQPARFTVGQGEGEPQEVDDSWLQDLATDLHWLTGSIGVRILGLPAASSWFDDDVAGAGDQNMFAGQPPSRAAAGARGLA